MSLKNQKRRISVVVVTALALAGGLAGPVEAQPPGRSWPGLGAVWSWLSTVLPLPGALAFAYGASDQSIDPNGGCADGASSDKSSTIDPNGANSDKSSMIDPNGANSDQSGVIDPNG